jgi:hypothetical protein
MFDLLIWDCGPFNEATILQKVVGDPDLCDTQEKTGRQEKRSIEESSKSESRKTRMS